MGMEKRESEWEEVRPPGAGGHLPSVFVKLCRMPQVHHTITCHRASARPGLYSGLPLCDRMKASPRALPAARLGPRGYRYLIWWLVLLCCCAPRNKIHRRPELWPPLILPSIDRPSPCAFGQTLCGLRDIGRLDVKCSLTPLILTPSDRRKTFLDTHIGVSSPTCGGGADVFLFPLLPTELAAVAKPKVVQQVYTAFTDVCKEALERT